MASGAIVCGLGHVGYRIAILLRRLGRDVTVIDDNPPAGRIQQATRLGIACLRGDARDEALLEQAGIRTAETIIAATDHDMVNLSVAMDARRLNPDIGIVVRLFDTGLAPHIESALALRKALSTSSLAAPVFTSAALGHNIAGYFTVADRSCTLSEVAVAADSSWLGMAWDQVADKEGLFPLFQVDTAESAATIAHDLTVQAGQRILVLRKAILNPTAHGSAVRRLGMSVRYGTARSALRNAWKDIPPAIKGVMAALAVIVGGGTLTFHQVLHLSPVDAFYFVITTISTTGYGDYNLQNSPAWLKLFGCFIMLCGAALMATIFSVVTDRLLKLRFRRLMETPAEAAGPHAILIGHSNISQRIAGELRRAGLPVIVLTPPSGERSEAPQAAYPIIVADPRSDAALARAGIDTATAVVAVTEDDILNLGVALQARKLNPAARSVIRTFDATLGAKLQQQLGGDAVISASAVSAPTFAACALCGNVIQATLWRDHLVLIQFNERGPCPIPDRPAPAVSLRLSPPGAAPGLGLRLAQAGADTTAPELRISVLRLD